MSITSEIDITRTGTRLTRVPRESRGSDASRASDLVQWFLDYYWIRHPISEAAIGSYRAGLAALERWLSASRSTTLLSASAQDLRAFLDKHYRADGAAPSDAPSMSCIKRFYFYLVEVGLRADDPTEHVYVRMQRRAEHGLAVIRGDRA